MLDKADYPLVVNDISDAPIPVKTLQAAVIGNQGVADAIFFTKSLMGIERITTDAQDLGVELFKTVDIPLKSLQFARSNRGEIGIVESKNHRPLLQGL